MPLMRLKDQLQYLPCRETARYRKRETIYSPSQLAKGLYLMVDGRVSVFRVNTLGDEIVLDIYGVDEF